MRTERGGRVMGERVVLSGGPDYVPSSDRHRLVEDLGQNVKLPCYGGYEHFTFIGDYEVVEGKQVAVMRWCGRTAMAE